MDERTNVRSFIWTEGAEFIGLSRLWPGSPKKGKFRAIHILKMANQETFKNGT